MVKATDVGPNVDSAVTNEKHPGYSVAVENDRLDPETGVLKVDTPKVGDK